ncbi:MAG: extracellular solute-binding protein [Caldilineaceae bacterium]
MNDNRQMSRRAFLRASSVLAVGAALAACAAPAAPSGEASDSGAAAAGEEKTTIRFHARIGQQEDALYDMMMPKFMEENPGIEIVRESFPGDEFQTKVSTMLAGGTLGDAVWSALGGATIYFQWAQGTIAPIDDLVASANVDLSEWYEGCINAITMEGNLLGLPFKAHPGWAVTYYNASAFEEVGLDVPTADWTLDDQIEVAKALQKSEGDQVVRWGYLPGAFEHAWKALLCVTRAYGGQLLNEDGTQFLLMEDEARQAVQYAWDLFNVHNVAPKPDQILGTVNEMWIAGQLAMNTAGTFRSVTDSAIGDTFEWMAVGNAKGPAGVGGSDYEVDAYCVTSTSEHPNEAFQWVNYLCNHESGVQLGIIGGTIGGRPDVYGDERLLEHPFRQVFKELMDNAQASRVVGNWRQAEAETTFRQMCEPLWAGAEQPTEEFLSTIAVAVQDVLDKPRP